ncbi:hypothetical protein GIB67_011670, partial [Kingdonia uniflora]
ISPTLRLSQLSVSFHSKKIFDLLKSSLNHISICAPSHSWITLHSDLQISLSYLRVYPEQSKGRNTDLALFCGEESVIE